MDSEQAGSSDAKLSETQVGGGAQDRAPTTLLVLSISSIQHLSQVMSPIRRTTNVQVRLGVSNPEHERLGRRGCVQDGADFDEEDDGSEFDHSPVTGNR